MTVPETVHNLVDRFHSNLDAYKSGQFNEAQARVDFINPLFMALGWDIYNRQGRPETYRDVVYEAAVKVGGRTKAPDYGFRTGGSLKFFLEAKKPSVNLASELAPAVQLRRYAWSANLPLSVLTDFEELAIYDCRFEPKKEDDPTTARTHYFTFDEYPDRWDEIYSLFSREAVLEGSLDKYAEETRRKRGTQTVNDAFLSEIESWRQAIARNLAARNGLNTRQLNYAVQMIIDRIIFLRMAEERGIEEYEKLASLLVGPDVYSRLVEQFRNADDRYNSGLFHFRREKNRGEEHDTLTLALEIDDKVLRDIIGGLYYPESPYEFSVLPVDVLGQVYEQFLGSVIHLEDDGHKATVEQKPEVRKAGGVYYTPTYIVDYIVENTVGKLLEGKRPGPRGGASKLKIVDPACGSGSFLIGAYEYLLDWHRDRYLEDGPDKHRNRLYEGPGGQWHLTIDEKRRILLNNIYGVDIDSQAVEVTKLSLLLKVLEGETSQTIESQLALFQERALPDLSNNIKCGNSLIGPDFYEKEDRALFEEEDHYRINVFDWQKAFSQVFEGEDSGFDAVIGNPPYIRIQALKEFAPVEVEHYKTAYRSAGKGNYDIYVVFVERGLELLNRSGRLGYILPHKFFNARYGQPVRELISSGKHLSEIVHFGDEQVFTGATTYTTLFFLDKAGGDEFRFVSVDDLSEWRDTGAVVEGLVPAKSVSDEDWNFVVGEGAELFERLRDMPVKLRDVAERIFQGIIPGADKVFTVNQIAEERKRSLCYSRALDAEVYLEPEILRKIVGGTDVGRYTLQETDARVIYPYVVHESESILFSPQELERRFPLTFEYFQSTKELLDKRDRGSAKGPEWYKYIRRQNIALQPLQKLAVPRLVNRLHAGYDKSGHFCLDNVDVGGVMLSDSSISSYLYMLGLLNSELLNFYFVRSSVTFRGGFFSANRQYIEQLPIRTIDFSDPEDAARHEKMVGLVVRMLGLHEKLAEAKIERERTVIGHQISTTDRQIDNLVYELYGLTDEEVAIVEESTR